MQQSGACLHVGVAVQDSLQQGELKLISGRFLSHQSRSLGLSSLGHLGTGREVSCCLGTLILTAAHGGPLQRSRTPATCGSNAWLGGEGVNNEHRRHSRAPFCMRAISIECLFRNYRPQNLGHSPKFVNSSDLALLSHANG